jgi:hypothetical protein
MYIRGPDYNSSKYHFMNKYLRSVFGFKEQIYSYWDQ